LHKSVRHRSLIELFRSDFDFEFAEIFVIEKRLFASVIALSRLLFCQINPLKAWFSLFKFRKSMLDFKKIQIATPRLTNTRSRRLLVSIMLGAVDSPYHRYEESTAPCTSAHPHCCWCRLFDTPCTSIEKAVDRKIIRFVIIWPV
jgi:hypothetical protein